MQKISLHAKETGIRVTVVSGSNDESNYENKITSAADFRLLFRL
jgi:hypothetical protein